jgi:hypothetical protein
MAGIPPAGRSSIGRRQLVPLGFSHFTGRFPELGDAPDRRLLDADDAHVLHIRLGAEGCARRGEHHAQPHEAQRDGGQAQRFGSVGQAGLTPASREPDPPVRPPGRRQSYLDLPPPWRHPATFSCRRNLCFRSSRIRRCSFHQPLALPHRISDEKASWMRVRPS